MDAVSERTGDERRASLDRGKTAERHVAYPDDAPVHALVARQAARTPNALAVQMGERRLSYAELNAQANQIAWRLRRLGAGPGTLVAVCLERSPELVVGLLGVLKAGAAYTPMDPAYPNERLAYLLADAQPRALITSTALRARLPAADGMSVIVVDAERDTLATEFTQNLAEGARVDDLAYVIYTSGSTGMPKGVEIPHRGLLNLIFWHREAFEVTPEARATQLAGIAFDATGWELWPYLSAGASVHLPDETTRRSPAPLRDWLVAEGITHSFAPTALAERMLTLEWPTDAALRYLLTGADALHSSPAPGLPFALVNNYGPTETSVVATSAVVEPRAEAATPPPIGWPITNTRVLLLDEHLHPVGDGSIGELYIGGDGLARGYLRRPELTAERFVADPFAEQPGARLYRTGDLARRLPDGQFAFAGRADDQIKLRGYRIEPGEIVAALNAQPGVFASAVVAQGEDEETRLVAYIAPEPEAVVVASELRAALARSLPVYMTPAVFVRIEALPTNANGKIARDALPTPDATNTLPEMVDAEGDETATTLEQQLADILAGLLRIEHVALDDNFFLLGGHSLLGTQAISRISQTFGVELSLATIFDAPTVRELAVVVEERLLEAITAMSDDEARALLG